MCYHIKMLVLAILIVFLMEGLGFILPREYIPFLFYLVLGLFYLVTTKKEKLQIPIRISLIYGLFLLFSLISSLYFSADKQTSLELTIFYAGAFLLFLLTFNFKEYLIKHIKTIIVLCSSGYTIYYVSGLITEKVATHGFQLSLPLFGSSHNHLGDFLGLALVIAIYGLLNRIQTKRHYFLFLFLPFFLISFSRSAFLALFVVVLIMLLRNSRSKLRSKKTWFVIGILSSIVVLFFVTIDQAKGRPYIGKFNKFLTDNLSLNRKHFGESRISYIKQGVEGLKTHALFGVGAGNFGLVSKKYQQTIKDWTDTSHSLIPEIFFENGALAGIFFLLFLTVIFMKTVKKGSLESYLWLYIFINFQTDYTYRIYSMFVLFMILSAVNYDENKSGRTVYKGAFLLFFLFIVGILGSKVMTLMGRQGTALRIYPFDKSGYRAQISQYRGLGCYGGQDYAKRLYDVAPGDIPSLKLLADYYKDCGDNEKAIEMLDKIVSNERFVGFGIVSADYSLRRDAYGDKNASKFFEKMLDQYYPLKNDDYLQKQIYEFCIDNGDLACQRKNFGGLKHFYEPDPKNVGKSLPLASHPENYSINRDTLNERFDYATEKSPNTFRIVVLGDSLTFGRFVKTQDNWTEKLENILNSLPSDKGIDKVEVINLAVNGYDIPYEVERFVRRGQKYRPDMVLWLISNSNFYQFNEILTEKERDIETQKRITPGYDKQISTKGNSASFELAYDAVRKKFGDKYLVSKVNGFLKSFRQYYSGKVIVITPALDEKKQQMLYDSLKKDKTQLYEARAFNNSNFFIPGAGQLNEAGHSQLALELSDIIGDIDAASK